MKINELHSWDVAANEAVCLQTSLAKQVIVCPLNQTIKRVAGADISFTKGDSRLFAAVVVMDIETFQILEVTTHVEKSSFPYVPGLLSFREIPPLLKAFEKLTLIPDIVICDGQGIAHPRFIGIATHLGLWLKIPTIGCGKSRLIGEYLDPDIEKGGESDLFYKGHIVGSVLRTKKNTKPLFVSPGYLIDRQGSVEIVKKCLTRFRLPEPTRQAHLAVNCLRLKNLSLEK